MRRTSEVVMRGGHPSIEGPAAGSGSIWWAERDDGGVRIVPA